MRALLAGSQLVVQPRAGKLPIAADFGYAFADDLGDLFIGISAEKTQLYDFGVLRIQLGKLIECVIQCYYFSVFACGNMEGFIEFNLDAVTLTGTAAAC